LVVDRSPFGELGLGRRPGFTVRPVVVQWHGVAFAVDQDGRPAVRHLWMPTPWLDDFLVDLRAGALDAVIGDVLSARPSRRSLASSVGGSDGGAGARPGAYGSLGDARHLVPGEPDPSTGAPGGGGPADRHDKEREPHEPRQPKPRRPRAVLGAAAVAAVVLAGAAVVVATSGDRDQPVDAGASAGTTTSVSTTELPTTSTTTPPATTVPLVTPGPLVVTATFVSSEPSGGPGPPPGPIELGSMTCSGSSCTYVIELSTSGEATVDLVAGTGSGRWEIVDGGECTGNPAFVGAIELTARVVDQHVEGELVFRADSLGETPSGQPGGTCLGLVTTFSYVTTLSD
jgi:hypothetical protein